uniref:Uncharacterized protein n=1 Tax=Trichogramma kaykai TaxID=54128 RepID=A0ABD2WKL7_9HYME
MSSYSRFHSNFALTITFSGSQCQQQRQSLSYTYFLYMFNLLSCNNTANKNASVNVYRKFQILDCLYQYSLLTC